MQFYMNLRRFHIDVRDPDTGEIERNYIVLEKSQLQAAHTVGQSSKELITRAYAGMGYEVVNIGKADKMPVAVSLEAIWRENGGDAD